MAKGHTLLWAGSQAAHGNITERDLANRFKFCVIFILYTQFTIVVRGLFIQLGGPYTAHGPRVVDLVLSHITAFEV